MTALVCAALAAAIGGGLLAFALGGPVLRRRVVVHTRRPDDQSVRGVLLSRGPRWVKLRACEYGDPAGAGAWTRIDGDVYVPRANVSFVQVLSDR